MDIVIMNVDRTDAEWIKINASVDLLHCPITASKAGLKKLGYQVYRPVPLKPLVYAVVERQMARNGGKLPLGGILVTEEDLEGLPSNPS